MDHKAFTIQSYNQNAHQFSKKCKNLTNLTRRPEFKRFQELLQGPTILDLGCGSGEHSLYFQRQELIVKVIDLSQEMIKNCPEKGLNVQLIDIKHLTFNDNSFDGIWAVTSLLHIPKEGINKVITKLAQILKKDGILYVCMKQGTKEELIKDQDGNTKRFFTYWQETEIKERFKNQFVFLESSMVSNQNETCL